MCIFLNKLAFTSKKKKRIPAVAQWIKNPTAVAPVLIPSLAQWVKGSGVAAATPQIHSLAWKLPYAVGVAIKLKNKLKTHSSAC